MTGAAERIAVDLNPLLPRGENGGAATASLNLVGELAGRDRDVLLLVTEANASSVEHLIGPHVERYVVRRDAIAPRADRRAQPWPRPWSLGRALGADVLFCPFGDPFWAEDGVPTVCTINDLQHLDHPEFFTAAELEHRAHYVRRLVAVADRVLVPSEFTKASVERQLRVAAPIDLVPYPAQRSWVGAAPRPAGAAPHRPPYLLYPANAWPHKNHERLLEAMVEHRRTSAAAGRTPISLVLTGSLLGSTSVEDRVIELGLIDLVHVLGHVPDLELHELYRSARGLIFPSLYEGFGLPVLEAMSFGIPVACSDTTSLPEVAAGAARMFDPTDVHDIAAAIGDLAHDASLAAELVERSHQQAATFAVDACVDALLRSLDAAAAGSSSAPRPAAPRPTVAVVMPSFQQASYIERSIESVRRQGDAVTELFVCDGGSDDGTVEILERLRDVLGFVSEPDGGQAAAVNKAVGKTASEVVAWLNSDDIYYKGALAAVAAVFGHHPELQWAYFACDHIGPGDEVIEPYYNRPWDPVAFCDLCFICQPGCFFRADLLERVGGLDESLHLCMDYDLWFRMADVQPPTYVPIVAAGSRLHPETKTLARRQHVFFEVIAMLARRHGKPAQTWLLGQIGDHVDRRVWTDGDVADSRRRHRLALLLAARSFVRHHVVPDPTTREVLRIWVRESVRRPASVDSAAREPQPSFPVLARLGNRLSPRTRRIMGRPYHSATRWVRRRTAHELEPRLQQIEAAFAEARQLLDALRADVAAMHEHGRAALELERIAFRHHQLEEALVERLTDELVAIHEELDRLRGGGDRDG